MTHIKAKDGERLDNIIFAHYGTLENFSKILEQNQHLKEKIILNDGDVINLPIFEQKVKKEVTALW